MSGARVGFGALALVVVAGFGAGFGAIWLLWGGRAAPAALGRAAAGLARGGGAPDAGVDEAPGPQAPAAADLGSAPGDRPAPTPSPPSSPAPAPAPAPEPEPVVALAPPVAEPPPAPPVAEPPPALPVAEPPPSPPSPPPVAPPSPQPVAPPAPTAAVPPTAVVPPAAAAPPLAKVPEPAAEVPEPAAEVPPEGAPVPPPPVEPPVDPWWEPTLGKPCTIEFGEHPGLNVREGTLPHGEVIRWGRFTGTKALARLQQRRNPIVTPVAYGLAKPGGPPLAVQIRFEIGGAPYEGILALRISGRYLRLTPR